MLSDNFFTAYKYIQNVEVKLWTLFTADDDRDNFIISHDGIKLELFRDRCSLLLFQHCLWFLSSTLLFQSCGYFLLEMFWHSILVRFNVTLFSG